jgi:hypothetical protein
MSNYSIKKTVDISYEEAVLNLCYVNDYKEKMMNSNTI